MTNHRADVFWLGLMWITWMYFLSIGLGLFLLLVSAPVLGILVTVAWYLLMTGLLWLCCINPETGDAPPWTFLYGWPMLLLGSVAPTPWIGRWLGRHRL